MDDLFGVAPGSDWPHRHSNTRTSEKRERPRRNGDNASLHPIVANPAGALDHGVMDGAGPSSHERCREIARALSMFRFAFGHESELQRQIAEALNHLQVEFTREVDLAKGSRIDFLLREIGVEVKTERSLPEALRQVDRYCQIERIAGVVLATTRAWAPEFPGQWHELRSKPVCVLRLQRALS